MKKFNLKVLIALSAGHMVTDIYQGALPAILPFLKDRLSLSFAMSGVILMVANFTSSVLQPIFGLFSDRKDRTFLLPLGVLSAGIGFSVLSFSSEYATILALVVLSGLGIAAYHPEGYKTAHFFTGNRSVTGMAVFSVGGNLGFSIGPILAIYTIQYLGFTSLPLMVFPAFLFTIFIIFFRQAIVIPAEARSVQQQGAGETAKGAFLGLVILITIVIMRTWTQIGIVTYIPFYYIDYLKGSPLHAGNLVFVFLVCGAIGTLIGAPFADRWGHLRFLRLTMFLATIVYPLTFIPAVKDSFLIFPVLGFQGMLLIATFSVTIVMAQKLLPRKLGIASGLMVGFAIGTGGIGATLLGIIADNLGVQMALESIMIFPFIGFLFTLLLRYRQSEAS